jgi:phospholipase C
MGTPVIRIRSPSASSWSRPSTGSRSHGLGLHAIVIAYDDSGGFCDHAPRRSAPVLNYDSENVPGPVVGDQHWPGDQCAPPVPGTRQTVDPNTGRCGLGPRLPLLLLSPALKTNTVDHTLLETTSILRMIEGRFAGGRRIGGGSFDVRAAPLEQ